MVKMSQILVWRCSRRKPYIIWPAGWAQEERAMIQEMTLPIKAGAVVEHCIIAENVVIGENAEVGAMPEGAENGVATVGAGVYIGDGAKIGPNAMIDHNVKDGEVEW